MIRQSACLYLLIAQCGQSGYVLAPEKNLLRLRTGGAEARALTPAPLKQLEEDPLTYLAAIIHGDIRPSGLSSLDINMVVTEILDAARLSAQTGKRVDLR